MDEHKHTEIWDYIEGINQELNKQKEINSKLVQAIEWLVDEIQDNNKWIGKLTGELTHSDGRWNHEAVDENARIFWEKLRKILPSDLLK